MSSENAVNNAAIVQAVVPEKSANVHTRPAGREKTVDPSREVNSDVVAQTSRIEQVEEVSVEIAEQSFSVDRIREMIMELEAALPAASNSLSFHVDEALDRPVITVVDKNSGEVVRTLPSEEIIRVAHNIEKMRGILFDTPV